MKRLTLVILALFLFFTNISVYAEQTLVKKELSVVANDGFNINATLSYPKSKSIRNFPTVVLLHSHGYNSQWWADLPKLLSDKKFAVLTIDLRGHGKSVYNKQLAKTSWKSLTNTAYAKYPDDIISVINYINEEYPKFHFFNNWAIVGSDIGASAGIIAADKIKEKPKTIVLLSPVIQTRSLYIPVHVAQLDTVDFLAISSEEDINSIKAENYLKKFAQKEFTTYKSSAKSTGMVILKNDPELTSIITEWISQYLEEKDLLEKTESAN